MNILHVASFVGNIGDNASHIGFYSILGRFLPNHSVNKLEIRKFYKNYQGPDKSVFDERFVEYANKFDLVVFGGGGFLDYWVKDSKTGTTIDLNPTLVKKIRTPTLFSSMGCMPHNEIPEGNVDKFRVFMDSLISNEKVKIAVRNDGSIYSLRDNVGQEYAKNVTEILDNGFFYECGVKSSFPMRNKYAVINITDDQLYMNSIYRESIDIESYSKNIVKILNYICIEKGLDVIFVPHIYSDLKAIYEIIRKLDNYVLRERVSVAPCIQFDDGANYLFSLYRNSDLTLASRLHANICSLSMGVPVIGVAALDRVKYVYDQLGATSRYFSPVSDFHLDAFKKIDCILENRELLTEEMNQTIRQKQTESLDFYSSTFRYFGFV